jgi:hypothetical protein
MKPHPHAETIGRTLSATFHEMKKANMPFNTYQIGGYLQVKIPGYFCPKCKRFTPGEDIDVCVFEGEHR